MRAKFKSSSKDALRSEVLIRAGIAALGVAAGLATNLARKAAVQAPTLLAGDWSEALKAEHAAVLKLFDAIEATGDDQTRKRSVLLTQIKHALSKHALQEENVIYPAMRDAGLVAEAEHLVVDHGDVKHYLFELDMMPDDSPAFLSTIKSFRADLEEHIKEEEDRIFPSFNNRIDDARRKLLTASMNKEGFKLA